MELIEPCTHGGPWVYHREVGARQWRRTCQQCGATVDVPLGEVPFEARKTEIRGVLRAFFGRRR